jgi:hypothetical protein
MVGEGLGEVNMIAQVEPFWAAAPSRAASGALGSGSVAGNGITADGEAAPRFRDRVARTLAAQEAERAAAAGMAAPVRAFGSDTSAIREGRPMHGAALSRALGAYLDELDASEPDWEEDRSPRDWVEANVDPETLATSPRL